MALVALIALILPIQALAFDQYVHCGGSRAIYGMNLGVVKIDNKPHMRSLAAVAAIHKSPSSQIEGWLGIDDLGDYWVEFSSDSAGLRKAFADNVIPFPGSVFSPVNQGVRLPTGFLLEACVGTEHG